MVVQFFSGVSLFGILPPLYLRSELLHQKAHGMIKLIALAAEFFGVRDSCFPCWRITDIYNEPQKRRELSTVSLPI